MKDNKITKGLVFTVILLFISVSFQPVFASDTISPVKKSDTKMLLETIFDIANNKEIQSVIQKSEIRGSPIRFQQLLGSLQKRNIGVIEKNDVLNERLKQLSDLPCDCEKNITLPWRFPFTCLILIFLWGFLFYFAVKYPNSPQARLWGIVDYIYFKYCK